MLINLMEDVMETRTLVKSVELVKNPSLIVVRTMKKKYAQQVELMTEELVVASPPRYNVIGKNEDFVFLIDTKNDTIKKIFKADYRFYLRTVSKGLSDIRVLENVRDIMSAIPQLYMD